jgi:hypothetical protein
VIKLGEQQQVIKLVINPTVGPGIPSVARVAVDSVQRAMAMGHIPHIDIGPAPDSTVVAQPSSGDSASAPAHAADSSKGVAASPAASPAPAPGHDSTGHANADTTHAKPS